MEKSHEERVKEACAIYMTYSLALYYDIIFDIENFQLHDDVFAFLDEFQKEFNITSEEINNEIESSSK
ncbi:hypothetical protein [Leuconostoc pseudomesenteroides]|uniref:hypothetical protein n=1 Tax=Leuconostoc pseudomesenteroides TaxID=33968 RepID=UPI0021A821B0|nr:hypothetical protein [Leuconostoc pseudomesenteroides]MCT4412839.1 hypothetical protein [Leuconostoc pseudomesenteroides]